MQFTPYFGVLAGALSVLAYAPYVVDTISGRTQPQRAAWFIWSILGTIAFFSQVYEEAAASLWFAGAQVSGTILILLLSFWFGKGVLLRRTDVFTLVLAAAGLVMWYQTEDAAYALAITIGVSLLGGVLTAKKAYANPASETLGTWIICLIASVFAILSVEEAEPVLLAYPVYLFTLYCVFIGSILGGRSRPRVSGQT